MKENWAGEALRTVVPALVIVILLNLFVAQATRVEGHSMDPTLFNDERVIIEKLSYLFDAPARGDIVVLTRSDRAGAPPLIKRVIGLAGETVKVENGVVRIDDQPLEESYLDQPTAGLFGPLLVPEGSVFVMGDNRNQSNDSRSFGVVPLEDIIGRAVLAYWPPSAWRGF